MYIYIFIYSGRYWYNTMCIYDKTRCDDRMQVQD